ncbi:hypothetical protein SK128_012718, partial [Halocaridina rubra]
TRQSIEVLISFRPRRNQNARRANKKMSSHLRNQAKHQIKHENKTDTANSRKGYDGDTS